MVQISKAIKGCTVKNTSPSHSCSPVIQFLSQVATFVHRFCVCVYIYKVIKIANVPYSSPQGWGLGEKEHSGSLLHCHKKTLGKSPATWSTSHLIIFNTPRGRALPSNLYPEGSWARLWKAHIRPVPSGDKAKRP